MDATSNDNGDTPQKTEPDISLERENTNPAGLATPNVGAASGLSAPVSEMPEISRSAPEEVPLKQETPSYEAATHPPIAPLPPLVRPKIPQKPAFNTPDDLARSISEKMQNEASSLGMRPQSEKLAPVHKPLKREGAVQQVRTFKSDVAHAVEHENIRAVDIVAAEENRKAERPPEQPKKQAISTTSIALILGTAIFLLGGGGALGFIILTQENTSPVSTPKTTPSLVFAEKTSVATFTIDGRNSVLSALIKSREAMNPPFGTLEQIKLVRGGGETSPALTTEEFLSAVEARTQSSFVRSLEPQMMIGIHSNDTLVPFLVFKTSSYEQAYAGMLAWEENIADDLSPFLSRSGISRGESFSDTVLKNKDARILRDSKGTIAYVYSFPDRETLVITTREETLTEIARRLSNTRAIRN